MTSPGETSGPVFRRLREAAGVPQGDMAARVGISHSHLSRFESGQRDIAVGTYDRLIEALTAIAADQRVAS